MRQNFSIGVLAGVMTDTNKIGYIADYPIFGMTANINAFALGVKMVNPKAKVISGMVHAQGK